MRQDMEHVCLQRLGRGIADSLQLDLLWPGLCATFPFLHPPSCVLAGNAGQHGGHVWRCALERAACAGHVHAAGHCIPSGCCAGGEQGMPQDSFLYCLIFVQHASFCTETTNVVFVPEIHHVYTLSIFLRAPYIVCMSLMCSSMLHSDLRLKATVHYCV